MPEWKLESALPSLKSKFACRALHLELRSVMCNGAEENQAHRCDPYGLRVQEQPLFLVCSSITIFTSIHRSENSNAGADQK